MNVFKKNSRSIVLLTAGSAALLLTACGGSGGGGSSQSEITPDKVVTTLNDVGQVAANCSTTSATNKASFTGAAKMMHNLITVSRSLAVEQKSTQLKVQSKVDGTCSGNPGSATVTSEHENGVTQYHLVFSNYCAQGPDGDTSYNGDLDAKEIGTPTDFGPMISELQMSMQDLEVKPGGVGGDTLLVTVKNARTSYGNPSTWAPDAPTSDSPDKTTVERVRIANTTRDEVHQIDGLKLDRVGGDNATVDITDGSYTNADGETVAIDTPVGQPIQVQISTGEISGGVVELVGANDTTAEIMPVPGTLQINVEVNGEPVDTSLNCDKAEQPVAETINLLLQQLPIY